MLSSTEEVSKFFTPVEYPHDHLDHIPRLVEKYKQAVLSKASAGDLTARFRRELASPAWQTVNVGQVAQTIAAIRRVTLGRGMATEARRVAREWRKYLLTRTWFGQALMLNLSSNSILPSARYVGV